MLGLFSIIYKIGEESKQLLLDRPQIKLGRALDNDLVLNDFSISRHHAEIILEENQFVLYDMKSRNGTRVNQRLTSRSVLKDGDEILLGTFKLQFRKTLDERVIVSEKDEALAQGTFIKPIDDIMRRLPHTDTAPIAHRSVAAQPKTE